MVRMFALAALLASLSACNTVSGIGRDISAGGAAISGVANTVREPQPVHRPYSY